MRASGATWASIRRMWTLETGSNVGTSTLPNRYERLLMNFTIIAEEDRVRLLEAKRDVEGEFERGKWEMVARKVRERGGGGYGGEVLRRGWRKMMAGEGVRVPEGMTGVMGLGDFEVGEGEEEE